MVSGPQFTIFGHFEPKIDFKFTAWKDNINFTFS